MGQDNRWWRTKAKQPDLQRVLERERARADRTGGSISLVVFYFSDRGGLMDRRMQRLESALQHRARVSDEIGRIDRKRIYVLLPDTEPAGGEALARDIRNRLAHGGLHVHHVVYRYNSKRKLTTEQLNGKTEPVARLVPEDDSKQSDDDDSFSPPSSGSNSDHSSHERRDRRNDRRNSRAVAMTDASEGLAACISESFAVDLPIWKRLLDISISLPLLVLALPAFIAISIAIKLDSPGPVFFVQERTGCRRRIFRILKFRTMVANAAEQRDSLLEHNEQDGPAFKITNDPRVTRVGKVLRKTSIDELPQLINVLLGQMTLVGPRPLPVVETSDLDGWHDRRHMVHPGVTGIWQITGRTGIEFDEWARMDLQYIRKRSLWTDLKIMVMTVPAVLRQEGAR